MARKKRSRIKKVIEGNNPHLSTEGWSPKVRNPALLQLAGAIILIALGVLTGDADAKLIGITMLGTGGLTAGLGRVSGSGEVTYK